MQNQLRGFEAMSRTISWRLWAQSPISVLTDSLPASRQSLRCLRPFSNSPKREPEGDEANPPPAPESSSTPSTPSVAPQIPSVSRRPDNAPLKSPSVHPKAAPAGGLSSLIAFSDMVSQNKNSRAAKRQSFAFDPYMSSDGGLIPSRAEQQAGAHHFHIFATRHNTHITVTRPDRSPMISLSAGNIGFRKSARKHYDSAFQLASYVLGRMRESGMNAEIRQMEVVLRGFGAGREAVTKALLGSEGRFLRGKVIKVADATRLKFGGTRSKKPRRLG